MENMLANGMKHAQTYFTEFLNLASQPLRKSLSQSSKLVLLTPFKSASLIETLLVKQVHHSKIEKAVGKDQPEIILCAGLWRKLNVFMHNATEVLC